MSIKQLRAAIAPCCGLGANRAEVDAALNNVSAQLSTQEQLLVETLNILEHSLKAIRLDAVTEELLQNHYGAIKAIREHFESSELPREAAGQSGGPYSLEFEATMRTPTDDEIKRILRAWDRATFTHLPCLDINTEFNDDALQTNNANLCQSTSQNLDVEKAALNEIKKYANHLTGLFAEVKETYREEAFSGGEFILARSESVVVFNRAKPWSYKASLKSIERRIVNAVRNHNYYSVYRLDLAKRALVTVERTIECMEVDA